ncbi:MAG TPA: A/G-specific adenine glycosylase [Burkholderiales bacterium]|nr:A/G-specific adenine glycosylase [Burkholderiales bacterium]
MRFAEKLIRWQRRHGRHDLPWQGTTDPYRIWLSEVMLQQTQVSTVIPYYRRFLEKYPTVHALAAASDEEVLELWSGLGYYARGRNLHKAARVIADNGFPRTAEKIAELPGVGRSTAAAIAAFAYGERAAILDGNVKRVLARVFLIAEKDALWQQAERLLPRRDIERYTQALMDLGATICTRTNPRCEACPLADQCLARKRGRIAEFPPPRERRTVPQREATWLVLRRNGAVLVERRPSPGIWGGLWCFPELNGKRPRGAKALEPIEHGFTHFRLRIQPVLLENRGQGPISGRWLKLEDAERAALPAPVKTLLARLREEGR